VSITVVNGNKIQPSTIIFAVVTLAVLAGALFFGLAVTNHLDANSTPILTVVLGFLATTVASLVAIIKVDSISHELRNGLISTKVSDTIDAKQVVTRDGPVVTSATQALIKILEANGVVDPSKTQAVLDTATTANLEKGGNNG
jgi:hypothetical protein